ncbi:hypothetical protein [Flavobacterium johnsoniae]|uniref:Peptidase M41 domain-containing protein n=2 Tax=Flavobacterium johnsoniae TaxID=986 RepID=A5FHI3_FLAJ1|nr:hypothetical protein [Flavobacterium johnsoniae]ABQ05331.1 hypothetical protein Fjoh_2304 [Flavobacterium johnsoniae UW101]OXE95026.1 hypothetical protein B0A63_25845 [Flavobacterium johnsoniae UW101]WQG82866.1 hypothetical protein SR927_07020 [Flavobacterium johnsoniae UW101]SHL59549.1 hypothetical protein SAMN05444146_4172 [Flavobacterium johnsoniae]
MTEILEKTAYHESGHIIMAYLNKYFCEETEILPNGDGKSTFNYGSDLLTITAITNFKDEPDIFNNLSESIKRNCPEIAFKSTLVLIAGSIAESIYLNDGISGEEMDVEISGPDLIRIENINFLLSQINLNHKTDFIPEMMYTAMTIFADKKIWDTITILAKSLFNKNNKKLSKSEIETILTDCGFVEYLKKKQ